MSAPKPTPTLAGAPVPRPRNLSDYSLEEYRAAVELLGPQSVSSLSHSCSRQALMSGIATGTGFGVIRGLASGSVFGAVNWAMGAGLAVCAGIKRLAREREQVFRVMEGARSPKDLGVNRGIVVRKEPAGKLS